MRNAYFGGCDYLMCFAMGLLRLILAMMVVFVHAGSPAGFPLLGGSLAVQAFYLISGFYMALILNEKYTDQPHAYRLFLTNRLLRLLPLYYLVVSLTLLVSIAMMLTLGQPELEFFHALRDNYDRMSASTLTLVAFVNLTLIGQDWLSFLSADPSAGTLLFADHVELSRVNLNSLLLVQPGWTISLELSFYAVAPLLVRRKSWVLVLVIIVSLLLRVGLRQLFHFNSMAWSYRFFPTELIYFVGGALSYKGYVWLRNRPLPHWLAPLVMGLILLYTVGFGWLHQLWTEAGGPGVVLSALYRLAVFAALPFVFLYTRNRTRDTRIGELSYPLYLLHFLVWESLTAWQLGGAYRSLLTLGISILLAYILNRLIGERVERVRQRVFRQQTPLHPTLV